MGQRVVQSVVVLMCCVWAVVADAEIYKWRDGHGVMNYSDVPPTQLMQAEKIKAVKVPADWPMTRADAYQAPDKPPAMTAQPQVPVVNEQVQQVDAVKAMHERLKAQNCAAARSNYRNYAVGGRMQTVTEAGEKEYLSDQQIQESLARAQQEIDENCPSE